MADTFRLSITTPEKTLLVGEANMVIVPGTEGYMGVLAGHAPLISTLKPGLITIEKTGAPPERIAVLEGIMEITQEGVTVLSDTARPLFGMTRDAAKDELARVQGEVEQEGGDRTPALTRRLEMAEMLVASL